MEVLSSRMQMSCIDETSSFLLICSTLEPSSFLPSQIFVSKFQNSTEITKRCNDYRMSLSKFLNRKGRLYHVIACFCRSIMATLSQKKEKKERSLRGVLVFAETGFTWTFLNKACTSGGWVCT